MQRTDLIVPGARIQVRSIDVRLVTGNLETCASAELSDVSDPCTILVVSLNPAIPSAELVTSMCRNDVVHRLRGECHKRLRLRPRLVRLAHVRHVKPVYGRLVTVDDPEDARVLGLNRTKPRCRKKRNR